MEREEAIELIRISAPAEHVEVVVNYLNPSARVIVRDDEVDGDSRSTVSHFGGIPSLPQDSTWPVWDRREYLENEIAQIEKRIVTKTQRAQEQPERIPGFRERQLAGLQKALVEKRGQLSQGPAPLACLGYLSLSEMFAVSPLPGLPRHGALAFFYASESLWGYSPLHHGHCQVMFIPEHTSVHDRDFPDLLPAEARFPRRPLTFECEWTLPTFLELNNGGLVFSKMQWYCDLVEKLNSESDGTVHRCGGYPQEIQSDMRLECQLVTNGIDCGGPSGYKDPRVAELAKGALDWRLLAQFDSDEERLGWMWGDGGRVYFWAREQDISAADFSKAWAILQCS